MALDPVTITVGVISTVFAASATLEYASRKKNLKDVGQNNITEQDCAALCTQIRTRWNELCLAQSDERYMKARWQQAAVAAAAAAATALALQIATQAALASIFGAIAAIALGAAALIASGLAVAAAGFASSAFTGWVAAETTLNSVRGTFAKAKEQMEKACGAERTRQCADSLPACA